MLIIVTVANILQYINVSNEHRIRVYFLNLHKVICQIYFHEKKPIVWQSPSLISPRGETGRWVVKWVQSSSSQASHALMFQKNQRHPCQDLDPEGSKPCLCTLCGYTQGYQGTMVGPPVHNMQVESWNSRPFYNLRSLEETSLVLNKPLPSLGTRRSMKNLHLHQVFCCQKGPNYCRSAPVEPA